jgi:hypothetical protein
MPDERSEKEKFYIKKYSNLIWLLKFLFYILIRRVLNRSDVPINVLEVI